MKLRGTATDKLADVIQVLQFVHRTGFLRVQRTVTDTLVEQGVIAFQDGEVVDASVGPFQGSDALKKLQAWTTCNFVFEAASLSPSSSPSPSNFSPGASPSASGMFPSGTSPHAAARQGNSTRPLPPLNPEEPPAAYAGIPYRLWQIQETLPDFQRLGLSRLHRQLFLLVDGKRSVYELMNLIRRHPQEVSAMLADLEYTGLIRQ